MVKKIVREEGALHLHRIFIPQITYCLLGGICYTLLHTLVF